MTQLPKADGEGMKAEFAIRVLDNDEGGDWRDLADLSGGEKVIACEALMNAITIYVNARSPMPIRTLFRDEAGAALDPGNGRALRRDAAQGARSPASSTCCSSVTTVRRRSPTRRFSLRTAPRVWCAAVH